MTTVPEIFGTLPDGRKVERISLTGPKLSAKILTLGATVQDLRLVGVPHPLILGYETLAPYLGNGLYVGAVVGRFANRIGGARYSFDGVIHTLDANFLGKHLLHGGQDGTHAQLWQIAAQGEDCVTLSLRLPDGHMGFPGQIDMTAEISVAGDALDITLRAGSDAATPCNLTHHGYFNLDGSADVLGHSLQLAAEAYLPVDNELIPTGERAPVTGTAFDFRKGRLLAAGYDHNFCLSETRQALRRIGSLTGASGLTMQIETTELGVQLYDGRHFSGGIGLEGRHYTAHAGVALEAQLWPDAPNQPGFPDAILHPHATYSAQTRYVFG